MRTNHSSTSIGTGVGNHSADAAYLQELEEVVAGLTEPRELEPKESHFEYEEAHFVFDDTIFARASEHYETQDSAQNTSEASRDETDKNQEVENITPVNNITELIAEWNTVESGLREECKNSRAQADELAIKVAELSKKIEALQESRDKAVEALNNERKVTDGLFEALEKAESAGKMQASTIEAQTIELDDLRLKAACLQSSQLTSDAQASGDDQTSGKQDHQEPEFDFSYSQTQSEDSFLNPEHSGKSEEAFELLKTENAELKQALSDAQSANQSSIKLVVAEKSDLSKALKQAKAKITELSISLKEIKKDHRAEYDMMARKHSIEVTDLKTLMKVGMGTFKTGLQDFHLIPLETENTDLKLTQEKLKDRIKKLEASLAEKDSQEKPQPRVLRNRKREQKVASDNIKETKKRRC
uniref:WEB family protein n=1 Tax=Caenorhabditis tropicalis TaxID=1561998 RepID=A0A1I7TC34_9PELO